MVRTLTTTLSTAVAAVTRRPYITLTAEDHINHLAQSVSTSGNSAAVSNACVASDGSIIRVHLTRGQNAFQQSFQWQRISDPTNASQWSTWTTFGSGSGNMFQDGGCCVSNNNGTLRAFAQQGSGGNALWNWYSTNNGASWTGPGTVLSPPSNALTKGIGSAGNNDVFFIYDVSGGEALGCSFYSGSWSSLHAWTLPTILSGSGLAVVWLSASSLYYVIYSDGYTLKECTATSNGATWSALPDIAPATSSAIGRSYPQIALFDGLYQLTCVEIDTGALTGTIYSYPRFRQSADLLHWSTGMILHDLSESYAVSILKTTPPGQSRARYVAAAMTAVQLGQDFQQSDSTQFVDLSGSILSYQRTDALEKPNELIVTLDNSGNALLGSLASYGVNYAPIGLNATLVLSEGYRTGTPPSNPEAVTVGRYHINQIIIERSPTLKQIRLVAYDLSRNLDIQNRYQVTYINQALSWLISDICARAGLFSLALPTTAQMSLTIPTFVLHAGQTYRAALDELCRVYWLDYFLDQNETLQFRELSGADASVWSYQPEIETLAIGSDDLRANHIIVSGKPPVGGVLGTITSGEAYDDTNLHTVGLERVLLAADQKIVTASQCASKAAFLLQQEQRDQAQHAITVPTNPALQTLDVITLEDMPTPGGTGLSSTARIIKSVVKYEAQKGIYELTLDLEGV
jgi:hypothetical protein